MKFLEDKEFLSYMEKEALLIDFLEEFLAYCEFRGFLVVDVLRSFGIDEKRFLNDPTEEDIAKIRCGFLNYQRGDV